MPKLNSLTMQGKLNDKDQYLKRWYKGKLAENGITQKDMAKYLDVSPGAISWNLKNGYVTMHMLFGLFTLCDLDPDEVRKVLRV